MLLSLRNSAITEEFDYNFIKHTLRDYKNPRVKINGLLKKGEGSRLVRSGLVRWKGATGCVETPGEQNETNRASSGEGILDRRNTETKIYGEDCIHRLQSCQGRC